MHTYPITWRICKPVLFLSLGANGEGIYHFQAAAFTDAMSTVIDGADQAQYGLPYFAQDDKSTTNGLKYKVCSPKYSLGWK